MLISFQITTLLVKVHLLSEKIIRIFDTLKSLAIVTKKVSN